MSNVLNYLSKSVIHALNILIDAGFEAYVVGGAVRDALLHKKINDYDIATNALPKNVIELFSEKSYKIDDCGIKHGTVRVINNNVSFEITTFRKESSYKDNRHPDSVIFTNDLKEDLIRRDFTINAMACSVDGDVIDIFNGIDDLNNSVIRSVGDPNIRFQEDALRMLRAIRFSSKLNFRIDEEIIKAIKNNFELIKNVSIERINAEIDLILSYKFSKHLIEFRDLFSLAYDLKIKDFDLMINKIDNFPDSIMKAAYVLSFIDGDFNNKVLSLKLSNSVKNKITVFYNNSKEYDFKTLDKYVIKTIFSKYGMDFGYDIIKYICYYNNIDILMINERIESIKEEVYTIDTLDINGNDLIELGYYKEQIGKALNILLDMVLSGKVKNEKNALIRALYKIDIDYMDYM